MDKQKLALLITKALAYTENGGKPTTAKAGKSGELKSIFQFLPSTWKLYSKQVLGQDVPLTLESEAYVVHKKVSDWIDHLEEDGTPEEEIPLKIASMWNAGERKADAYKENHKGTNKYGVAYDTPAYAKKVGNYVKEFSNEGADQVPPDTKVGILPKQELAGKLSGLFKGNVSSNVPPTNTIGGLIQSANQVS